MNVSCSEKFHSFLQLEVNSDGMNEMSSHCIVEKAKENLQLYLNEILDWTQLKEL